MTAVVLDASAVVELVRATPIGQRVHARTVALDARRHVPQHCAVEVANAIRGLLRGHRMPTDRAARCVEDLGTFTAARHRIEPLLPRIWELRHNLTAYDAAYVALAEALDAPLVTVDEKLNTRSVRKLISVEMIR